MLDFVIVAVAIFLVIRGMNACAEGRRSRAPKRRHLPAPSAEVQLLGKIRDLLERQ